LWHELRIRVTGPYRVSSDPLSSRGGDAHDDADTDGRVRAELADHSAHRVGLPVENVDLDGQ
jgi:hypothetical protein